MSLRHFLLWLVSKKLIFCLLRILFKWNVLRAACCSDAGVAVADGFVGGGVFAEVVADVFDFDVEGEVFFAVVDAEGEADHFG